MRILETERLHLRQMEEGDLPDLRRMLKDPLVMRAYGRPFDEAETLAWYESQQRRYRKDGFGLWAVTRRGESHMIGQCGLTWQQIPGRQVLEIGYLFQKAYWHQGYAIEAARACKAHAFTQAGAREVYSIIRDINLPSINVAVRNGMTVRCRFVKRYRCIDMPHLAFSVRRGESPD